MALTTARITPQRMNGAYLNRFSVPMATATTIYTGALVCVNASGFLVNGSTATTLTAVGVLGNQPFEIPSNGIVNSGANGAKNAEVLGGTFKFNNDGTAPVDQADFMKVCYILDNETVSADGTGRSIAGLVVGLDDATSPTGAGVWVQIGGVGPTGPTGGE